MAFSLMVGVFFPALMHAEEMAKPAMRLPGIYHGWSDADQELPKITMEEVKQCMQGNQKIKVKVDNYRAESEQVNQDNKLAAEWISQDEAARKVLDDQVADLQAEVAKINQQNSVLMSKKEELSAQAAKKLNDAQAKALNVKIEQFNKDLAINQKRSLAYKSKSEQFDLQVKNYNQKLELLQARLVDLNASNQKFREKKIKMDQDLASHVKNCKGERQFIKEDVSASVVD